VVERLSEDYRFLFFAASLNPSEVVDFVRPFAATEGEMLWREFVVTGGQWVLNVFDRIAVAGPGDYCGRVQRTGR
jgi:hypothetical protein